MDRKDPIPELWDETFEYEPIEPQTELPRERVSERSSTLTRKKEGRKKNGLKLI